ncbi:MAG: hypothetical protein ACXVBR_07285 [Flavisolibacter sp.]
MKKIITLGLFFFCLIHFSHAQDSTQTPHTDSLIHPVTDSLVTPPHADTTLRIVDLNPFITLHVDSTLEYQLQINKNPSQYFWFLRNAPVGLRIQKDNGTISFKADKSYFHSGKLKYDVNYKVFVGVQNLSNPNERIDTSFTIVFYNTEIIPSKVKPTVSGNIWIDEGETASFKVLCETGSFPIENIITLTSVPISNYKLVQQCGDEFTWTPSYDFVKETDSGRAKNVIVYFIGTNKFKNSDTAMVRFVVKDALNYPLALEEFNQAAKYFDRYVLQLKYTFLQLDKKLKKTKNVRTTFDLTSTSTSLTGTILSSSSDQSAQRTGKILPSVGLALIPIKEASVPNKVVDQNQASQIRSYIKRLEYMRQDNVLVGEKDPDISKKTNKLKDELKQVQAQLIDIPIDINNDLTEEQLNRYFNSPKVNKKYRMSK